MIHTWAEIKGQAVLFSEYIYKRKKRILEVIMGGTYLWMVKLYRKLLCSPLGHKRYFVKLKETIQVIYYISGSQDHFC